MVKPGQLILSNLDYGRGYIYKLPPEFPISHDLRLSLFSNVGTMVGTSLRHHRHIRSSGNLMVQGAFNRVNKFSRAFFFWLSRPSDPKIFQWLSAIAGPKSRFCQSHVKQVSSHMQNLTKLQFGSLVREKHAVQLLLAGFANATIGRLWNDFELQNASNLLTLAGAAAIVPPLENMSTLHVADGSGSEREGQIQRLLPAVCGLVYICRHKAVQEHPLLQPKQWRPLAVPLDLLSSDGDQALLSGVLKLPCQPLLQLPTSVFEQMPPCPAPHEFKQLRWRSPWSQN